jgi:DNA polymerase III alpha subunit
MKIQLRVRTEYSFGSAFGRIDRVIERLKALGTTHAGMVEIGGGTWGHVQWEKACNAAGIVPLFGAEFAVVNDDDESRPVCWALARDVSKLYRLTTLAHRQRTHGMSTLTLDQIAEHRDPGLIMFAGGALKDPELFDYVDINPGSIRQQRAAVALARATDKPWVITSDNAYPAPGDRDAFLLLQRPGSKNSAKPTAQHILSTEELPDAFPGLKAEVFDEIEYGLLGNEVVAETVGKASLRKAPLIRVDGDLESACRAGINQATWAQEYEDRLRHELKLIDEKGFSSYFLVVADLVRWAKERMLVGPARGSSAGSLVCYLLRITEVDPIPYGLIFERFVDVTRNDFPDIDIDFSDIQRDSIYEYLRGKYGADKVARIGTISTLQPRSALALTSKALAIPVAETYPVKNAIFERLSGDERADSCLRDTLNETTPGNVLLEKHPAIALAGDLEGHASHTGVHAAGVCICNEPIDTFCTVSDGVMQLDKYDCESLNMLKVDVLGLRVLGVIEDAGVISNEELYELGFDDPKVFALFNARKYCGIFQWDGGTLQRLTNCITVTRFEDLEQITALARPGPLGAGAGPHYTERHEGLTSWDYPHESMREYLDETFGLVLYQEQVLRVGREIGGLSWDDVTLLRKGMSKSYGDDFFASFEKKFVEGAAARRGIKADAARSIWHQIKSMGAYAFNKSHSVGYAAVSYWTAYLKTYFPIEFAAAVLRNAQSEGRSIDVLREIVKEDAVAYVPFDPDLSDANWTVKDGKLIGGFMNLKGIGNSKARAYIAKREAGKLTDADRAKLMSLPNPFLDLFPLHTQWSGYFSAPEAFGIEKGWKLTEIANLPDDGGEVVVLGLVKKKSARDSNEDQLVKRRGGERLTGNTSFLDVSMVDDSTNTPLVLRVDRKKWDGYGKLMLDRLEEGRDVLLIRGRKLPGLGMVMLGKAKCLTNPDIFK